MCQMFFISIYILYILITYIYIFKLIYIYIHIYRLYIHICICISICIYIYTYRRIIHDELHKGGVPFVASALQETFPQLQCLGSGAWMCQLGRGSATVVGERLPCILSSDMMYIIIYIHIFTYTRIQDSMICVYTLSIYIYT